MVAETNVAVVLAALFGACLGFIPYNMNPAKIFMGDTGATFLGYILATLSVTGLFKMYAIISFAVPFLILGVPIFDICFAFLRRIAKGQLSREAYESGRDVEAHFSLHFHLFETREIARTLPLDTVQRAHLVRMTPLLFGVDAASLPLESLNEITIAARLLIGRVQPEACETTAK